LTGGADGIEGGGPHHRPINFYFGDLARETICSCRRTTEVSGPTGGRARSIERLD
jgi:hypothetical protein